MKLTGRIQKIKVYSSMINIPAWPLTIRFTDMHAMIVFPDF
jgi:hypothetical protein